MCECVEVGVAGGGGVISCDGFSLPFVAHSHPQIDGIFRRDVTQRHRLGQEKKGRSSWVTPPPPTHTLSPFSSLIPPLPPSELASGDPGTDAS